mgnify:CR=1 FL=1
MRGRKEYGTNDGSYSSDSAAGEDTFDGFMTVVNKSRGRGPKSTNASNATSSAPGGATGGGSSSRFGMLDSLLEDTADAAELIGPSQPPANASSAASATATATSSARAAGTRFNIPASALQLAQALAAAEEEESAAHAAASAAGGKKSPYVPLTTENATASAGAPANFLARMMLDGRAEAFTDASDNGTCLSMHQPWASLLVHGLKRFEGRPWFTPFKGRLWIAATSRQPEQSEIDELEAFYRRVYGANTSKMPFPRSYPHAALLGCVDMLGCWDSAQMAEYARAHPTWCVEPNESHHVFVCANPRVLPKPIPMSGNHKLWTLPAKMHKGLADTLKPVGDAWLKEAVGLLDKGPKVRTVKEVTERVTVEKPTKSS